MGLQRLGVYNAVKSRKGRWNEGERSGMKLLEKAVEDEAAV